MFAIFIKDATTEQLNLVNKMLAKQLVKTIVVGAALTVASALISSAIQSGSEKDNDTTTII